MGRYTLIQWQMYWKGWWKWPWISRSMDTEPVDYTGYTGRVVDIYYLNIGPFQSRWYAGTRDINRGH